MDIFNPNSKTRFFGKLIPNIVLYGIIAVALLIGYKIYSSISSFFSMIADFFGLGDKDKDPATTNQKAITNTYESDPAVKSQITVKTRSISDDIYNILDNLYLDRKKLNSLFGKITGPNQMKAVYVAFGERTISPGVAFRKTGNLKTLLEFRLGDKINEKIKIIGQNKYFTIKMSLDMLTK